MAIKFLCPTCQKALSLKEELAGKQGKCPRCQSRITVPHIQAVAIASPPTPPPVPAHYYPESVSRTAPSQPESEDFVWKGRPSQLLNIHRFVIYCLFGIIFAFMGLLHSSFLFLSLLSFARVAWAWMATHFTEYFLTNERLRIQSGVLSRTTENLELYRVKDIRRIEPFLLRVFGLGTLQIITSDATAPNLHLRAIPDGPQLQEIMRKLVEKRRDTKGVRELDVR